MGKFVLFFIVCTVAIQGLDGRYSFRGGCPLFEEPSLEAPVKTAQSVLEPSPTDVPYSLYNQGCQYFQEQDFTKSEEIFVTFCRNYPDHELTSEAWLNIIKAKLARDALEFQRGVERYRCPR